MGVEDGSSFYFTFLKCHTLWNLIPNGVCPFRKTLIYSEKSIHVQSSSSHSELFLIVNSTQI